MVVVAVAGSAGVTMETCGILRAAITSASVLTGMGAVTGPGLVAVVVSKVVTPLADTVIVVPSSRIFLVGPFLLLGAAGVAAVEERVIRVVEVGVGAEVGAGAVFFATWPCRFEVRV